MPKIKTHSGAKKRVTVTKTGKIKMSSMNRRHDIKGCKSTKRMPQYAGSTLAPTLKRLVPYK